MIEKMTFLSISGPKDDIDRVVSQYLSRYDIHLENALSELRAVQDLRPFTDSNPYREVCQKAQQMKQRTPQMYVAQQGGRMPSRPNNGKIVEV